MMPEGSYSAAARYGVSILVVLDWTMMLVRSAVGMVTTSGFNPCCIGLDNDAPIFQRPYDRLMDVSILVVLDWTMMLA